ncbi:DUF7123 family protein [Halosimplex sp. J119]
MESEAQPDIEEKRERLVAYLREAVADGNHYLKSRDIAASTDLSPQEVGACFRKLRNASTEFTVEKWAYTKGTTWRVERSDS